MVASSGCGLHCIRYTHTLLVSEGAVSIGRRGFVDQCCSLRLYPSTTFSTRDSDTNSAPISNAIALDVSPGAVLHGLAITHSNSLF